MTTRLYTPEIAETILEQLEEGQGLNTICTQQGMPSVGAVRYWVQADVAGFSARYAQARARGLECLADEILEIADDSSADTYEDANGFNRADPEVVQRSKLRVDARKWLLSKLIPKTYGDRLELAGEIGVKEIPDDRVESRIAILLRTAGVAGVIGGEGAAEETPEAPRLLPGDGTPET